jgi:hypothetical protein
MKITHCEYNSSRFCSSEGSFYVANGALMIEPVTAVPAFIAQFFTKAYAARKFAANGDDAGVLGQFAFGAWCTLRGGVGVRT